MFSPKSHFPTAKRGEAILIHPGDGHSIGTMRLDDPMLGTMQKAGWIVW